MSNVSRLSWELELDGHDFSLLLRRDQVVADVGQAVRSCIGSIATTYTTEPLAIDAMWQRVDTTRFALIEGTERVPGCRYADMPNEVSIGIVDKKKNSNVIDILTKERVCAEPATEEGPAVYLGTKALAEEAAILKKVATSYIKGTTAPSLHAKENMEKIVDDTHYLASLTVRIAAARRLLRYVLFPDDCLALQQQKVVGFESWLDATITPHYPQLSKKMLNTARGAYVEEGIATKSLRKTIWAPLLHQIIDTDPSEICFYMLYIKTASDMAHNTFVFDDPGTIILNRHETGVAINSIFVPKRNIKRIK